MINKDMNVNNNFWLCKRCSNFHVILIYLYMIIATQLFSQVNRFIVLNVMDVGHNIAGNLKKIRIVMRMMKKK